MKRERSVEREVEIGLEGGEPRRRKIYTYKKLRRDV